MTAHPGSEDYEQGYAEGVRDAIAGTGQRVAALLSLRGETLRVGLRDLHRDAGTRWATWADRRDWPSVRQRVARACDRGTGEGT